MTTSYPTLADRPRVLARVLEQVAAGNRRPRGLAEALDLEPRVIAAYLTVGAWLGVLDLEDDPGLTRAGLAWVCAGRRRAQAWSEVVRGHAFARRVSPDGAPPSLDAVVQGFRAESPEITILEARKRAVAYRRLVLAGFRTRLPRSEPSRQLELPLTASAPERPRIDTRAGNDDSPDLYAFLLRALLVYGEVTPAHVRGILDAAGGSACGIGGPMAMAVRRGDARREGDTLVVTEGALRRRDVADSAVSIALSDPDFRIHLVEVLAGRPGDARRFRPWMARLFGSTPPAEALPGLLFGRSLENFPLAGDLGPAFREEPAPFLTLVTRRDLALAFPPNLDALSGGVAVVNAILRTIAQQGAAARPPSCLDRARVVHAGLFHPGENPPRSVADMVALRARAVANVPAFAILCALGVLDRRGAITLAVTGNDVILEGARPVTMDALVRSMALARGWALVQPAAGARWGPLAAVAERLGLLARPSGNRLTLEEAFFRRLQVDPEHRDTWEALLPLVDLVEARATRLLGR